jgi:TRAP transporter TAXI family solute receptor
VTFKGSSVWTLADLKGKRVSVGAPRSDVELAARAVLAEAGIKHEHFGTSEYLAFVDAADLLKKRALDAFFHLGMRPDSEMRTLARATEIAFLDIPPEVVAKLGAAYRRAALPANSYTGQPAEVATALVPHYLVTRADLSEAEVHTATKAVFEQLAELATAHPAGRAIRLDSAARRPPVPLHPGAAKYFKEKGVRF